MMDPSTAILLLGCLSAGVVLGSVPFGLLLVRLAGLGDLRSMGSGNIGTTNVLRTGRKDLAALTLILDSGKGAAAALSAAAWAGDHAGLAAGLGAVLGHSFSLFLKGKGGKGVATTLGTLLAMHGLTGLIAVATWVLVAAVTRYSSLAALVALSVAPAVGYALAGPAHAVVFAITAVVVWVKHRDNVMRLRAGTEPRIGSKSKASTP